ncbi:hypothetical protein TEA_012944 [Camellia sinensis var. sinensis]|uniref:Uncharacterized protein n=1 Tax=Camellia sinensis var. sinensis TaxID=542762 RepID=A0A4S4DPX8_CAMSN|nr:hypothetical protein TEA_012944 [Camellia sinensis var. sinensis]
MFQAIGNGYSRSLPSAAALNWVLKDGLGRLSRIGYRHLVRFGLGRGSWPIRIGCLNPKSQLPRLSMMTMQSLNNEDFYFICLEILCSGMAKTWQACHIRKAILSSVCKWESILEAPDNSDSVSRHWFQLIEDSK